MRRCGGTRVVSRYEVRGARIGSHISDAKIQKISHTFLRCGIDIKRISGRVTTQRVARSFSTSISMKAVTSASASSDWTSYFDRIRLTMAGAS